MGVCNNNIFGDLLQYPLRSVSGRFGLGMTNVGGLVTPERIPSDIGGMVPDPLKGASNEDKVDVTWHELRVQGASLNEFFH